jgi:hypothetical protein
MQDQGPPTEGLARPLFVTEVPGVPAGSQASLLEAAVRRAFGGDYRRFERFVACLRTGLPEGTKIALRGSAVAGSSFVTGEPFDAAGSGTSDIDVVVIGTEAMGLFVPEAFYVPAVNSKPLCDATRWIAPELDAVRTRAQALVRRPVAIQAMAGWFLDLRAVVQGQPHVLLADAS